MAASATGQGLTSRYHLTYADKMCIMIILIQDVHSLSTYSDLTTILAMLFSNNGEKKKPTKPISKNIHQRAAAYIQGSSQFGLERSLPLRYAGSRDRENLRRHRE